MNFIGINCYGHGSSAAVVSGNKLIATVEEERFTRKKYCSDFPKHSIAYCLKEAGLTINDIDAIGFSYRPWIAFPNYPGYFLRYFPDSLNLIFGSSDQSAYERYGLASSLPSLFKISDTIKREFNAPNAKFKFHFCEHHLCHAASAYFLSPFEDSNILTVDAMGEWTTTQMLLGKGNTLKTINKISAPHSLGGVYNAVSVYAGFGILDGPGKIMGAAAYGDYKRFYDEWKKIILFTDDGGFRIDLSYFGYHTRHRYFTEKFVRTFGPPRNKNGEWEQHQYDAIAGLQRRLEDTFIHMVTHLQKVTGSKNLCIAGGVGLNGLANGRIVKECDFDDVFVQPAAGDPGTAVGAAALLNCVNYGQAKLEPLKDAFLGPGFTTTEIEEALKSFSNLSYTIHDNIEEVTAKLLADQKIVGWFQGRMEFGPRALGGRSIICDPRKPEMKDILNKRVKFREPYRPFAPVIPEKNLSQYFDSDYPAPYMLTIYNVLPDKRSVIPSVTHYDGTGRVQTVNEKINGKFYRLIKEFEKLTGVPVILNTSFNVKGEPIVCTPQDAIRCFLGTDIDILVMDNFVVNKHVKK